MKERPFIQPREPRAYGGPDGPPVEMTPDISINPRPTARMWPAGESPAQHCRNAVQLLRFGRVEEAEARLWRAIEQLEKESRQ